MLNDLDLSQALFSQEDWHSEPLNRSSAPTELPLPVQSQEDISPEPAPEPAPVNTNLHTSVRHRPDLMTRLIGREEMLEELEELVSQPETRLISLVGPGGTGKTRTALAMAENGSASRNSKMAFSLWNWIS